MRAPGRASWIRVAIEVAVILGLHCVLIRWMSDRRIVSTVLAGGSHVPRSVAVAAGVFLLVRLYAVLLLPGLILARVCALVLRPGGLASRRPAPGSGLSG